MVVQRQAARRVDEQSLNQLFRALADGTRRDIVSRVLVGEESVSRLAARYEMSFAAVQKHVATLERAGLVTKRASGREQLVAARPSEFKRVTALLEQYEALWCERSHQLDDLLNQDRKGK
jgi:DNA-binding transcriptional ArsR family regulator